MNRKKRVEALERARGLGRYDDGQCICQPPAQLWATRQSEPIFPDVKLADEPLPGPGLCERCGRKKHLIVFNMVFDPVPNDK
jgi:hypothetical protein